MLFYRWSCGGREQVEEVGSGVGHAVWVGWLHVAMGRLERRLQRNVERSRRLAVVVLAAQHVVVGSVVRGVRHETDLSRAILLFAEC